MELTGGPGLAPSPRKRRRRFPSEPPLWAAALEARAGLLSLQKRAFTVVKHVQFWDFPCVERRGQTLVYLHTEIVNTF